MYQEFHGVEIKAISACVPKRKIVNDYFENLFSPKELKVFEKTVGIIERRWAEDQITSSDLGYEAAENLFKKAKVDKKDIDCLLFLSQTPDYKIPFTSNILQNRLGLKQSMLCLDLNAGCAGFIQGLSIAFAIAKSLKKEKVLFIVAETMSKIISHKDRGTSMLFGDGAAAVLIENTGNLDSKSFFNFYSDGQNANAIQILDGGYRNGINEESIIVNKDEKGNLKSRLNLSMDGPKVFDFTLREIAPSIKELLSNSGVEKEKIDYFLLHQSNEFIIKQIASKLDVPLDKMPINIARFGNTSGVSIPLLMASKSDSIQNSETLLLSGYGVGLNWGNCILDKINIDYLDKIEI